MVLQSKVFWQEKFISHIELIICWDRKIAEGTKLMGLDGGRNKTEGIIWWGRSSKCFGPGPKFFNWIRKFDNSGLHILNLQLNKKLVFFLYRFVLNCKNMLEMKAFIKKVDKILISCSHYCINNIHSNFIIIIIIVIIPLLHHL